MNTRAVASENRMSQWTQIIQERMNADLSVTEFCQKRGISKNRYYYWQRKVRESTCEQMAMPQSRFTEVCVSHAQSTAAGQICVAMGGLEIKLDAFYPPEKLAVLVRELTRS